MSAEGGLVPPGTLLLAVPQMLDPNFMHSVVLMVEHTSEGAYGLVVNRPSALTIGQVLAEHPMLSDLAFPVHFGGPVGRDSAFHLLHQVPDDLPGSMEIAEGTYLGGDLDSLGELLCRQGDHEGDVRAVLGYSGWGSGQLDFELEAGSWLPAPSAPELVFSDLEPEEAWRAAVRRLGDLGESLSRLPPDVSWN